MVSPLYASPTATQIDYLGKRTTVVSVVDNNTTFLGVRDFAKATGMEVTYDSKASEVSVTKDSKVMKINTKTGTALLDDKDLGNCKFILKNDKIYLPLRFICENMSLKVYYEENGNIRVASNTPITKEETPTVPMEELVPAVEVTEEKPALTDEQKKEKISKAIAATQLTSQYAFTGVSEGFDTPEVAFKISEYTKEATSIVEQCFSELQGTEFEGLAQLCLEFSTMMNGQFELGVGGEPTMSIEQLQQVVGKILNLQEKAESLGIGEAMIFDACEQLSADFSK